MQRQRDDARALNAVLFRERAEDVSIRLAALAARDDMEKQRDAGLARLAAAERVIAAGSSVAGTLGAEEYRVWSDALEAYDARSLDVDAAEARLAAAEAALLPLTADRDRLRGACGSFIADGDPLHLHVMDAVAQFEILRFPTMAKRLRDSYVSRLDTFRAALSSVAPPVSE